MKYSDTKKDLNAYSRACLIYESIKIIEYNPTKPNRFNEIFQFYFFFCWEREINKNKKKLMYTYIYRIHTYRYNKNNKKENICIFTPFLSNRKYTHKKKMKEKITMIIKRVKHCNYFSWIEKKMRQFILWLATKKNY